MKNIILGAGITGLAAGIKTGFPIYEATDRPGGICRSYYKNGYRFENGGGHWIFGDNEMISFIKGFASIKQYDRDAGVYFNKIFKYPIQKTLDIDTPTRSGTLKNWMRSKFGRNLCNIFFYPFNEKYTDGLYNYVMQEYGYKSPAKGSGYNTKFFYPIRGLDHLVDEMEKKCSVNYNKKVMEIRPKVKRIFFSDGTDIGYNRIISTIPLKETLRMIGIVNVALPKTSVLILNIGADVGARLPKEQWLYFPYSNSGFYRVGIYNNVDHNFAPKGKASFYVERSFHVTPIYDMDKYKDDVIKELQDFGFIGNVDVCDHNTIDYAYTWLYPSSPKNKYLKTLKKHGIESIGRYGKWRFQGIAESVLDGLNVIL